MNSNNMKFAWLIKNFSSLPSDRLYSASVLISDVKWRLFTYPKGYPGNDSLIVYLYVPPGQSLASGWGRYVNFRVTLVNQLSDQLSIHKETKLWYHDNYPGWGVSGFLPITKLYAKDGGFLVNDELKIVAEIEAFQVIGIFDESKEPSETPKKIKQDDDGAESKNLLKKTPSVKERVDVNGFQVLPSQVESVRRIFELHPDIAVEFHVKKQHLRTAYMNFLLGLMETLSQPLAELSDEDLEEAEIALGYLKNASFKLDWLVTELEQVKDKVQARIMT